MTHGAPPLLASRTTLSLHATHMVRDPHMSRDTRTRHLSRWHTEMAHRHGRRRTPSLPHSLTHKYMCVCVQTCMRVRVLDSREMVGDRTRAHPRSHTQHSESEREKDSARGRGLIDPEVWACFMKRDTKRHQATRSDTKLHEGTRSYTKLHEGTRR